LTKVEIEIDRRITEKTQESKSNIDTQYGAKDQANWCWHQTNTAVQRGTMEHNGQLPAEDQRQLPPLAENGG